jgi:amino-acid N-acetyltransferase
MRPARRGDLGAVLALLEAAGLPTDGLADAFPAGYFVVEADGEPIGIAGAETYANARLLRSLAVAPAWRGRGIGRMLTERVVAAAREDGVEAVYLLTTTIEARLAKSGFARIGREAVPPAIRASVEFAHACPESAACMYLKLS